jgi:2-isopropylmalate synthase
MARSVLLYDTTLRDGMQREGMSVSVDEKIRIARRLADLGIHIIEGGFLGSNPKDEEFFRRMEKESLGPAVIAAFGMTRARGVRADRDGRLCAMAESWVAVATIVGKTWPLHVEKVLRVSLDENLRMIEDSVRFLESSGKRVYYDAEHFFDGYRADADYALACVRAAADAGAEAVVLCDTNGAALPDDVASAVDAVIEAAGGRCGVGIHTHNDSGCAVANALVAIAKGADSVQGTINGYGERCGNADLCALIPDLKLKLGIDCISDRNLRKLTDTAHFVAELCNVSPDPHQPYVGRNAFAHKGGLHVSAVTTDPKTFEHIDPALVGNEPHVLVSELSGRATISRRAHELGYVVEGEKQLADRVLKRLKDKERDGYQYEAADASFELLLRAEMGTMTQFFQLESFRVIVEKREDGTVVSEATVKVHLDGDRYIETAEGNGPVNALDRALRLAVERRYPQVRDIRLVNYSVRILDENKATGATTRVLLDSSNGRESWGSVGVSVNVVEASWQALADSITFGLLREECVAAPAEELACPIEEHRAQPKPPEGGAV